MKTEYKTSIPGQAGRKKKRQRTERKATRRNKKKKKKKKKKRKTREGRSPMDVPYLSNWFEIDQWAADFRSKYAGRRLLICRKNDRGRRWHSRFSGGVVCLWLLFSWTARTHGIKMNPRRTGITRAAQWHTESSTSRLFTCGNCRNVRQSYRFCGGFSSRSRLTIAASNNARKTYDCKSKKNLPARRAVRNSKGTSSNWKRREKRNQRKVWTKFERRLWTEKSEGDGISNFLGYVYFIYFMDNKA